MITADLYRTYGDKQTLGSLVIEDGNQVIHQCKTLELPDFDNQKNISCIPEGEYTVTKRFTANRGYHFHVQDVPGRTWILIHKGNYTRDILGCILPGKNHTDIDGDGIIDVTHSKSTLNELIEVLPDKFKLTIRS